MNNHKFNIGDIIENGYGTQKYLIIDIDEANEIYICVDALCGRGIRGIYYNRNYEDFIGWAQEEDFKKYIGKVLPIIDYRVIEEYKWSKFIGSLFNIM